MSPRRSEPGTTRRPHALIITQYSLPQNKRNMNAYQRVFDGSDFADITLVIRAGQNVSEPIAEKVRVLQAPVANRWLFLAFCVVAAGWLRLRGLSVILTEPSGFAAAGFLAKYLFGYFWVMDVWDRPRWRTGKHEEGMKVRLSDRVVFGIMALADYYLLSVMPQAARDMHPPADRCLQLNNAIDISNMAANPPERAPGDEILQLAYGRSEFHETMGLDVVIRAAEVLKARNCPFVIHLVGELSAESMRRIEQSPAADRFKAHGFISMSRSEFFRRIHAGLVPYLALEDLSHIFPIKVIEHLSQGNPVIASRLPGLCSMIRHEYNGLVVNPGDPEDLADAVERLQKDRGLWEQLSRNALQSALEHDCVEKNRKIFSAIAERMQSCR
jgi:glycosyltransferase involved in cell wall biosynthesis